MKKIKTLILTLILISIYISGCEPTKPIRPQPDIMDPCKPHIDGSYIKTCKHTTIGDIEITRINTTKGVFTILGHHYCKEWTKINIQGNYVFMQNKNKIIKKREMLK